MSNLVEIQNELQSKRKELQHELGRIDAAISALSGLSRQSVTASSNGAGPTGRRILSIGARRRIAAAQRARLGQGSRSKERYCGCQSEEAARDVARCPSPHRRRTTRPLGQSPLPKESRLV